GFSQPGPQPAARTFSRCLFQHFGAFADVGALVLDLLHIALGVAVADELPIAIDAGLHDVRVRLYGDAVDVHHARNLEIIVDLQQPPETHAISILMPAPIG